MSKIKKPSKKSGSKKIASIRPGKKTVVPAGNLGTFIQSILDKKGFSQTEVARRGGIDSGNLTNMIGGSKSNPEFQTIRKLSIGLEEPYLRVCVALLEKEEDRPNEYWFDNRLMLIDDLLSQLPEIERARHEALIEALQYSLMKAYREQVAITRGKRKEEA